MQVLKVPYVFIQDLSENQLGTEGAKSVVDILSKNHVVTSLTLEGKFHSYCKYFCEFEKQ